MYLYYNIYIKIQIIQISNLGLHSMDSAQEAKIASKDLQFMEKEIFELNTQIYLLEKNK